MHPYKGYVKDQPGFKLLYENKIMSLGHIYEETYCYNKLTKEEIGIWRFKYEPTCGVIGKNNDWCDLAIKLGFEPSSASRPITYPTKINPTLMASYLLST